MIIYNSDQPNAIINDAIHGMISFPPFLKKSMKTIIDHPLFQRLRHIRQLGLADMIYPTAVHNRFSHSIGAAYVASEMCHALGGEITVFDYQNVVIATLLHDIGHGPFSHNFETIVAKLLKHPLNHEAWTAAFVEEILRSVPVECDLNQAMIIALIEGNRDHPLLQNKQHLCDIVSSQFDADRMDYLLRDSYFCGVPYGHFHLDWLFRNLTIVTTSNHQKRIALRRKAASSIEHFLSGRRLMTLTVYHHPKTVAAAYLLEIFMEYLYIDWNTQRTAKNSCVPITPALEAFFLSIQEAQNTLTMIEQNFIKQSFATYSLLTDLDIWYSIHNIYQMQNTNNSKRFSTLKSYPLAQRLCERKLPRAWKVDKTDLANIKSSVASIINEHYQQDNNWKLYFYPLNFHTYTHSKNPILLAENLTPIDDEATSLRSLPKNGQTQILICDIYDEQNGDLQKNIKKEKAIQEIRQKFEPGIPST